MRIKPFVKFVNYNHVMPTRYNLDVSEKLAAVIPDDSLTEKEKAAAVRKVSWGAVFAVVAARKRRCGGVHGGGTYLVSCALHRALPFSSLQDVKATLEERYKNLASSKNEKVAQGVHYFFRRLRF